MRMFTVVMIAAAAGALGGCVGGGASVRPATSYDVDKQYVAHVEKVARKRGVAVHWVNPPRRPDGVHP